MALRELERYIMAKSGQWVSNIKISILLKKGWFSFVKVSWTIRITHLHGSAQFTIPLICSHVVSKQTICDIYYADYHQKITLQKIITNTQNKQGYYHYYYHHYCYHYYLSYYYCYRIASIIIVTFKDHKHA